MTENEIDELIKIITSIEDTRYYPPFVSLYVPANEWHKWQKLWFDTKEENNKKMITYNKLGQYGRFGNQLFQIASTIGIALRNKRAYGFPAWYNHDHKASGEDIDVRKYFANELPKANVEHAKEINVPWGYSGVRIPAYLHDVSLSGYLQSPKFFYHCIEIVRYYFKMKNEVDMSEYVAIHIRRGDYDPRFFALLGNAYYHRAMAMFPIDTKFLVFSDEPDKAAELLDGSYDFCVRYGYTYLDDFRDMKRCKSFITANSSYSVMAAILADHPDKKIICPKQWFGPQSPYTPDDIYPHNSLIV